MQIRLCGVRGREHVTGDDRRLVGHATSCIVVEDDRGLPLLVLDGGTGYRRAGAPGRLPPVVPVLLSHLHHDHLDGVVAARPSAGRRIDVRFPLGPTSSSPGVGDDTGGDTGTSGTSGTSGREADARAAIEHAAGRPLLHLDPSALRPGDITIGSLDVRVRTIPHGEEPTVGFRVSDRDGCVAYLPDHSPQGLDPGPDGWGAYHHDVVELAYGVDLLLHGAMLDGAMLDGAMLDGAMLDGEATERDRPDRDDRRGRSDRLRHTTVQYAVGLAERCHARALVLVHHHPAHTDRDVAAMVERLTVDSAVPVVAGREGDVLVPRHARDGDPIHRA